jgi:tetratricopeptide (TPR) repeat protein
MKYKHIWALPVVFFLVSCGQPPDTTRTTRILEHRMAGDQAYMKDDYAEAEKQYKNALALAELYGPEEPLVLTNLYPLGMLYMTQKRDAEAEAVFRRRIKLAEKIKAQDPEGLASVYEELATLYLLRGRYSEAEPVYKRALALYQTAYGADSPKMAEPLKYYASLLRRINHNDEAADLDARAANISSSQNR